MNTPDIIAIVYGYVIAVLITARTCGFNRLDEDNER